MTFQILSVLVPIFLIVGIPKLFKFGRQFVWLLGVACAAFFISWYLPSPLINGQQTQFMTHFVGGGIFSGLLWLYIKIEKKWHSTWWVESATLYALVSSLGIANELFELFLYKIGQMPMGITDTSWDLLANTMGSVTFYVIYLIIINIRKIR